MPTPSRKPTKRAAIIVGIVHHFFMAAILVQLIPHWNRLRPLTLTLTLGIAALGTLLWIWKMTLAFRRR